MGVMGGCDLASHYASPSLPNTFLLCLFDIILCTQEAQRSHGLQPTQLHLVAGTTTVDQGGDDLNQTI